MGAHIIHFDDKPWQDLDDELYYRCYEIPWYSTTKTTISRLTPYTEPDIEQVRKEWYQHGLNDAREGKASCQFCEYEMCSDRVDPCRICACNYTNFFEPKKQGKEEQITKGDIVLIKSTPEVEILVTYADEEYVSGIALTEVDGNCEIGDQYTNIRISNVEKTGKHYDIASVLQKMKEANNG